MSSESSGASTDRPRVLVLGASGMLGWTTLRELTRLGVDTRGSVRNTRSLPSAFIDELGGSLVEGVDALRCEDRRRLLDRVEPDVVINCVGVIKQAPNLRNSVETVQANALLPHELAEECTSRGARLVHISTDCVFSGHRGLYVEDDVPDPVDFYGRSKLLGEVPAPALTLRTSIIGPELQRHSSLLDWFLTQPQTRVRGFEGAIYSGVTTVELARMIAGVVLPDAELSGLYHVASEPIAKYDLLHIVAEIYGWGGVIEKDAVFRCDRSMNADRLRQATGYAPPSWRTMIHEMHRSHPSWLETYGSLR